MAGITSQRVILCLQSHFGCLGRAPQGAGPISSLLPTPGGTHPTGLPDNVPVAAMAPGESGLQQSLLTPSVTMLKGCFSPQTSPFIFSNFCVGLSLSDNARPIFIL